MEQAVHRGNLARKVRSLLMKTVPNGCTAAEAQSSLKLANDIVDNYKFDRSKFEWPPASAYEAKPEPSKKSEPAPKPAPEPKAKTESAPRKKRTDSKQQALIDALRAKGGATADELLKRFGWLPHTLRGSISNLKRKQGLVPKSKREGGVTRYWLD